jgi:hypothetical protein
MAIKEHKSILPFSYPEIICQLRVKAALLTDRAYKKVMI